MSDKRYIEGDDVRALRGLSARDRIESEHDLREDETPVEALVKAIRDGRPDAQTQALGKMHDRLQVLERRVNTTIGVDNDDGKLGRVVLRVEAIEAEGVKAEKARTEQRNFMRGLLLGVMAALGTAGGALYGVASRDGRNETRLEQLEHVADKLGNQIESLWRFRVRGATGDLP